MCSYNYEEMDRYVSFCEAVEENAIKLEDRSFVRLTRKELRKIAQYQQETDEETFMDNWEDYVGEIVFLYDNSKAPFISTDYRIADKDSLTRYVARTLVKYMHDGHGNINDVCMECSIALMLFIRNGLQKRDFAKAFQKELIDALQLVNKGKEELEIEKVLLAKNVDARKKVTKSLELFEVVYEDIDRYDNIFVYVDSEIELILQDIDKKRYPKEEIKKAIHQYVLFDHAMGTHDLTREMVLKNEDRDLFFTSVGNSTHCAAEMLERMFFYEDCTLENVVTLISKGIAVYRKNELSDAEFWENVCKDFQKALTSEHFYLNWQE